MNIPDTFPAFRIHHDGEGHRSGNEEVSIEDLSPGEIVIRTAYSSVNYKDALAGTGTGKILRRFPLVGGIDVAGHVVASIANGPDNAAEAQYPKQYIASGSFTDTVDFGTRTGRVRVGNLDGANYVGATYFGMNSTTFAGALVSGPTDRGMVLEGSFFRGAASPIGEMGGNVSIVGVNYLGSGIFAARMH